jgi:hypothetical protein
MADRDKPGKLGNKDFAASGSVDSDGYIPRDGAIRTFIQVTATEDGSAQVVLVDNFDNATEYLVPAVAVGVTAGETEQFLLEYPIRGAYRKILLRYTNTSAAPGTAKFSASDGEL